MDAMDAFQKYQHYVQIVTLASGVCLHLGYFNRGEHHMYAIVYLQISLLLFSTLTVAFALYGEFPWVASIWTTTSVLLPTLLGIYGSLLCYRLVWHPLGPFPGPVMARISSLWFSIHVRNHDAHQKALDLYNKYGAFVRVGSSDLMIAHPLAVAAIHGSKSTCRKASWYDEDWPRQSIHTSRDPKFHADRRRLWSQSFSNKALRGYERRIAVYNQALVDRLTEHSGHPIDAAKYFEYYGYDVMGDLAFNRDFGMLKSGEQHFAVELLAEALSVQGFKLPTWLFRILVAIPSLTKKYWTFIQYCNEQLATKMAQKDFDRPSLMNVLLAQAGPQPSRQELLNLESDSRTIIVAGSDTVAATLSHAFYLLTKYPEHVAHLRQELLPLRNIGGVFEHQKIERATHLNAVINETLRLYPVPPTAIVRKTPPEGIFVADTYIPGNINVWTPQYVIGRSEAVYEDPDEFIPARWYPGAPGIIESAGFAPFLTGMEHSCYDVKNLLIRV